MQLPARSLCQQRSVLKATRWSPVRVCSSRASLRARTSTLDRSIVISTAQDEMAKAIDALVHGRPVCMLDDRTREGETDMYFPGLTTGPAAMRQLRTCAGGELYISIGHEVSRAFGLPLAGTALEVAAKEFPVLAGMSKFNDAMCQGSCSVGISLDHRSTKTGAPDNERCVTVQRLAEMAEEVLTQGIPQAAAAEMLGKEFHLPGHIFLCQENPQGLATRRGHTELSIALARAAGVVPVMVGCVMLSNEGSDYGALGPDAARAWAAEHDIPFLEGPDVAALLGFERASPEA